jgi:hypothetical protein
VIIWQCTYVRYDVLTITNIRPARWFCPTVLSGHDMLVVSHGIPQETVLIIYQLQLWCAPVPSVSQRQFDKKKDTRVLGCEKHYLWFKTWNSGWKWKNFHQNSQWLRTCDLHPSVIQQPSEPLVTVILARYDSCPVGTIVNHNVLTQSSLGNSSV